MLSKKIYNQFISDGDYVGAANYLSRAHFSDPVKQSLVNRAIKKLRTDGRRIQGMMSRADENQRKAFSFLNAVNSNGILPGLNNGIDADGNRRASDNVFSKDYAEAKRRLGSQGSKEAESLSIKFGGQTEKRRLLGLDWLAKDYEYKTDAFEDMLRRSRLSKNALIKSGAKVKIKDGQYILDISKRNPLFNKVYNALLSTKGYDNKYRFQVAGVDAKGKLIGIGDSDKDYINWRSRTDITDTDGYYVNPTGNNNFEMPNNIVAVANKAIRPVKGIDNDGSKLSTVSSMILPFNSARRKQISDSLNGGRLNTELANALIKENSNAIINGLMNADFTQYEMYVTDEENYDDHTTVRHVVDNSNEKANIQDLVRAAIASGKFDPETQVSLGMQGNQTGYVITIPTKIDKNTETGNQIEDIKQNSRQIFIPDFMNGEAEKVFSQNSQTRAMKELASMEMYNYGVDIPQDGKLNVYNNPDTGTAVYQMEYSDGSTVQIGKDEALRNINKMLIIEDGIDNANSLFYDEDGNIRKGIKQNGKINANFHNDLVKKVDAYVTSAMSELYPEAWQSFKPFASYAVNGDFESEDYKTKLAKAMESFIDSSNINLINNQRAIYSSYILDNIGMNDSDMYNIE